jgi:hypothetical protein
MNIDFNINNMDELSKRGFSIDQLTLLTWIQQGIDLDIPSKGNKMQALYQSLVRKNLIDKDKLTTLGENLLLYYKTNDLSKLSKKKTPVEKKTFGASVDFSSWWYNYPGTDTFSHKGISFDGTRSLRVNIDRCRAKFEEILAEGEYTATDMIEALNFDVLQKKENSVKLKTNKLTYMQNSLTYLNQHSYEPFIELIKEGNNIINTNTTFDGVNL